MKFLHQEFIEIQNKDSFSWSFGSKNALLLFQSTLLQCLLDYLDWEENILFFFYILKHVQPGFWLRQSTTSQLQWLVGNGWHSVTVVRHMRHKFWKDWKVPSKSQKSLGCSKVCGLHESLISCSLEPVYCIQARYQIWSQHGSQQQLPHGRTQWKQLTVLALEWGAVRDKGQTDKQGWKMMKVNECPANAFWIPGKYGTCFSPVALPHGLWFAKLCMNFVSGQPPSDILLAWLAVAKQTGAMGCLLAKQTKIRGRRDGILKWHIASLVRRKLWTTHLHILHQCTKVGKHLGALFSMWFLVRELHRPHASTPSHCFTRGRVLPRSSIPAFPHSFLCNT